jgi:hypothetical protein
MSEDIGAVRRFPLAKLCSTQHLGHGARTRVFPSDENTAAAMVLPDSGPFNLGPASGDVSANDGVLANKMATFLFARRSVMFRA